MKTSEARLHHVIIIGGGFAGLNAAKSLAKSPVRVTLVDRRNFHLFQPLLYQVATGVLSPGEIAAPLRGILKRRKNVLTLNAEVVDIDPAQKRVSFKNQSLTYDTLIVATGSSHHYFGEHSVTTFGDGGIKTSTPVIVMAKGPSKYADRVRGFIDNTDIAKIINDAFLNQ